MIVIVDYGMGNLRSVQKKLKHVGVEAVISSEPKIIGNASKIVLPGVGHFAKAVKNIKDLGILEILNTKVLVDKTPILGICLGLQIMAKHSEEGNAEGLGWFDADVVRFKVKDSLKYKIPHTGWNNTTVEKESALFKALPLDSMFYFVHTYHIKCHNKEDILGTTEYEYKFTSAIQKGNIFGVQFHPEKSHDIGEKLIKNFVELI